MKRFLVVLALLTAGGFSGIANAGVVIGASVAAPVYVAPAPVYAYPAVQPVPVYAAPAPVVYPAVYPAGYYVAPAPVAVGVRFGNPFYYHRGWR